LRNEPDFDWARAAVTYNGLGRALVLKLKYGASGAGIPALANLMTRSIEPDQAVDLIVPVPLHRRRLLARRFNQSQLLAANIAKNMGRRCDPFMLNRSRATPSQGTLTRKGRVRNVQGAFKVPAAKCRLLKGQSVLLVDDVLTTGATASACARALKKAGAASVGVLAFARVGNPATG